MLESPILRLTMSQKPILKPSSFPEYDVTPSMIMHGPTEQISLQTSLIDFTEHPIFDNKPLENTLASSQLTNKRPGRALRALTLAANNMPIPNRKRVFSFAAKDVSAENLSVLNDYSETNNTRRVDNSVQQNSSRETKSPRSFNLSRMSSVNMSFRTPRTRNPSREKIEGGRQSVGLTPIREAKGEEKGRSQSILNDTMLSKESKSKESEMKRTRRKESIGRLSVGSVDGLRKERYLRFFEGSMKRALKMTQGNVVNKEEDKGRMRLRDVFRKEVKNSDADVSIDAGRSFGREERKREMAETVFYRELNEVIHFCAKENDIPTFLKAMGLLGDMYLHYEKLDEAFHCFTQLRWASSYFGVNRMKAKAYMRLAECCKLVDKPDEAIRLFRKALQYSWEFKLANKELKIYDILGKIYYVKGETKKAYYYHERCAKGEVEPKDSPIKELYNIYFVENGENVKVVKDTILDAHFMSKITLPSIPGDSTRKHSFMSSLTNMSFDEQKKIEINKRPANVRPFLQQLSTIMRDPEILIQKKRKQKDQMGDVVEEIKKPDHESNELPSPTYKTNFAAFGPEQNHEARIKELAVKEERIKALIKSVKKESMELGGEAERKKRIDNAIQLQIAFQRQKRLVLGHQQEYRILAAQLWKSQYHPFEGKKKAALEMTNQKKNNSTVMENKFNMDIKDPDFFQSFKHKAVGVRLENNLPPFVLMTHKKMTDKSVKKDKGLMNDGAKKMYLKFYKKVMKKVAPERMNKLRIRDDEVSKIID